MKNAYEIRGEITAIFLNHKGNTVETLIDTEDLVKVKFFPNTWITNGSYAMQRIEKIWILLHREIMDSAFSELKVDHINRIKLDNRKANLRFCTQAENKQNMSPVNKNSSNGRRGVNWSTYHQKWFAQLKMNQKKHFIGYFDSIEAANKAVMDARSKLMPFSEEAELNPNGLKYYKDKEKPFSTNRLGVARNICFDKSRNQYHVRIVRDKITVFSKRCNTLEEAEKVAKESREKYPV